MKKIVFLLVIFICGFQSEQQPDIAHVLQERYEIKNGFRAEVTIKLDVPGIVVPDKSVEIYAENNKPIKIKGEGLVLLPKKGFVRQFSSLFSAPVHWIQMERYEDYEIYKLVSLDPKSDWVTADIKIFMIDPRIDEMTITTRDAGVFTVNHFYDDGKYPSRSEINFTTEKLTLPLKFMGKSDFQEIKDTTSIVTGKIFLEFMQFEIF